MVLKNNISHANYLFFSEGIRSITHSKILNISLLNLRKLLEVLQN